MVGDVIPPEGRGSPSSVRASRDGHAYHEAWAARSALELLPPNSTLQAIAVEGFSVEDEKKLGAQAVEVADLVRYHGGTDVTRASRVEIIQFKYSIADADTPVRAADLVKTLAKFASTEIDLRTQHGTDHVRRVVRYDFATNRPIHANLLSAIEGLVVRSVSAVSDVGRQTDQILFALKSFDLDPAEFLGRLDLSGRLGSLKKVGQELQLILAAWGEAGDPESEKRLLKLQNLVRSKVGSEGEGANLIDRVAVLAELDVDHETVLYPTPDAFPPVAHVIPRAVVENVVAAARATPLPVVVHGAGGMGKTVLLQAVADRLRETDRVVVFDGYGGGKWRDPADGRERPQRTLVHLANLLAGQGLCDILLPLSDESLLLRAFRRRLEQAVQSSRQVAPTAGVALVLDAIGHAALQGDATGKRSFAHLLLGSLAVSPIPGVTVVASCRTERLTRALDGAAHVPLEIPPFSPTEARALILATDPSAEPAEIAALESRSGRNPRCLDALLTAGRPYDGPPPGGKATAPGLVLEALLRERIEAAKAVAQSRGATRVGINTLLTGLSLLPPPVPISELAAAHGLSQAEVESFVADLAPLLERTPHGLMFRDEPTETLIRNMADADLSSQERIVESLTQRQSTSNYAARALPAVLTALRRGDALFALAFDPRMPPGASKVSQRDIQLSRLAAALDSSARSERFDDMMRLLLEASLVAAGHERSDRFLYEHPDLAAVGGDSEALRRLFQTKVGWPGGRHSALALANAFAGDFEEARRNSQRAIDWHNWAVQSPRRNEFRRDAASTAWDDVGFAYVEILTGGDLRIVRWLNRRTEAAAFGKFADLFDLLERHSVSADGTFPPEIRLRRRLHHCRSRTRALWIAALQYSKNDPASDRRLIARLAATAAPEKEKLPDRALLGAVVRAIALGLTDEAATILDQAAIRRPDLHAYSSYWPIDQHAEVGVIAAGVAARLRRRPPTLLDLVPNELLELVPARLRGRGSKAFEAALTECLSESPGRHPTRGKRRPTDYEQRQRANNALTHRIKPLLPYATLISSMLSAQPSARSAMFSEGLARLQADVESGSDYPYRDGKAYVARVGFTALFDVADAIGALDASVAQAMVDWLKQAPGLFAGFLTSVVLRLSRMPALHSSALDLATNVETRILTETDTSARISAYGDLARAVWRVDPEEAAAYFRRALDLAEAIGSDDFERTNHLLALTGAYAGSCLSPAAAHDLARIFELNQSEDSKFPWIEYAKSMAPTAGLAALAMVARLDDRGKADLGLSLGPMLTVLVESGKLPAELASCLVGLDRPVESWTWRLSEFVAAVAVHLEPTRREALFQTILIEMDRAHQLAPPRESIARLTSLAERYLSPDSPSLSRIRALGALRPSVGPEHPAPARAEPPEYPAALAPSTPDAIDRAIAQDAEANNGRRWPERVLKQLMLGATTPAGRRMLVEAVVESTEPSLADKLRALEPYLPDWAARSSALRDRLPELGLELARRHAADLVGNSWDATFGWRQLTEIFGLPRTDLSARIVEVLAAEPDATGGDAWLALAANLAPNVGPAAFREGLERYLALTGSTLPAEVGDGPWDIRFSMGGDAAEAAARLIWSRLGAPKADSRWRAAHAVRRLADAGRFDVIAKLVAMYSDDHAFPFCDAHLPFYPLHARLWMLIALARISKDAPAEVAHFRTLLEAVAFSTKFPHVVMRTYAAEALREVAATLNPDAASELLSRLAAVNVSPYPPLEEKAGRELRWTQRPTDRPKPTDEFHLDYEFSKYAVAGVSGAFATGGWEIEDGVTRWVRSWDPTIRGMYDCARIGKNDYQTGSWSSGSTPDVDRYGGYLGWHALMLVSGELLASRPTVSDGGWRSDRWKYFMSRWQLSRADGLWLSDATDLAPTDLVTGFPMPAADTARFDQADRAILAPMVGVVGDRVVADALIVSGHWSLPGDLNVSVATVLAQAQNATTLLQAALTDRKFSVFLPDDEDEVAQHFRTPVPDARPWVTGPERGDYEFDQHDPYRSPTASRRRRPATWLAEAYDLTTADPFGRAWLMAGIPAFAAQAWGATGGRGDWSWDHSGERIAVGCNALQSILEREDKVLVGLVRAQHYISDKAKRVGGDMGAFTHRLLAFSVDREMRVTFVSRIPRQVRAIISSIEERDRSEFHARYAALKKAKRSKGGKGRYD